MGGSGLRGGKPNESVPAVGFGIDLANCNVGTSADAVEEFIGLHQGLAPEKMK
jgi:hypothetical protein